MFNDCVGDGAELLGSGSGFVVGFEFGDYEALVFVVVIEGFDAGGRGFESMCFGVVKEGVEGGVDKGGINEVLFGFLGEGVFPVLSGGFVDLESAFEVGFFFAETPVAESSSGDAGDSFEGFVGGVGEVSVITSSSEDTVPEGVCVG